MKKFLAILGLFIILSIPVSAISFLDVNEDHENYMAIEYLYDNGVINGYEDGNFGPDDELNRAQATKVIVSAFEIAVAEEYEILFPDVLDGEWYFESVMAAKEAGIIGGYDNGDFGPDDKVTLAQALKMAITASGIEYDEGFSTDVFLDISADDWAAPYFYKAREANLILANNEGKIHPHENISRGDFAEIIYKLIKIKESGGNRFPLHDLWQKYEAEQLPVSVRYDENEWQVFEEGKELIFHFEDPLHNQFSYWKIYPNSARMVLTVDQNEGGISSVDYFMNLKNTFLNAQFTEFQFGDFAALEMSSKVSNSVDWYIYLENGYVLAVMTDYGNGQIYYKVSKLIGAMLESIEYVEKDLDFREDYEAVLSEIFEHILVENRGMEMLDKLPDRLIFETDAIGVGTGPVDYYYSGLVDYTFKYEREADVILDKREGKSSAF